MAQRIDNTIDTTLVSFELSFYGVFHSGTRILRVQDWILGVLNFN